MGSGCEHAVSTALVIGALAGIGAWGYGSDWSLPKFSALVGSEAPKVEAWCEEHNVPESQCIECNKELCPADDDYGWCTVHGVAKCPLEHPDVAQLKAVPSITPAMLERANRALALRPRAENNSRCNSISGGFSSPRPRRSRRPASTSPSSTERPVVEAVVANGEVVYDETRMAHLASRVAGTVWRVEQAGRRPRAEGRRAGADRRGRRRPGQERVPAGHRPVAAQADERRAAAAAGRKRQRARPHSSARPKPRCRKPRFACSARSRRW